MVRPTIVVLASLAGLLGGCSGKHQGVLPDGGLASITDGSYGSADKLGAYFSPLDKRTFWTGNAPGMVIAREIDEDWMQDLAGRLSICTWPEQENVPASSTWDPFSLDRVMVSLQPNSALADRWYALRLSALPSWMAPPEAHRTPDGAYIARFRTGSEPLVRMVSFAGGPNKPRLTLEFSESLSTPQDPASFVQVQSAGASVVCSDASNLSPSTSWLFFDCPSLTTFPDHITIGVGLFSTTGVALVPVTIDKAGLTITSCGHDGSDCQKALVP